MSPIGEAGSNPLRNAPVEIIGLIDQILSAFEEALAGLERDTEVFAAGLFDIPNCIQSLDGPESLIRSLRRLKSLAMDRQSREQARYERISRRASLIREKIEEARAESALDALTHLPGLDNFNRTLQRWTAVHEKSGVPFTIALFGLDDGGQFNETSGRPAGEESPALFVLQLGRNIRAGDFLARRGGDQFAVLSPGMELASAERRFSELLRRFPAIRPGIAETESSIASFGVSCGIAEYAPGEGPGELTDRALNALGDAKRSGGNRVAARLRFF